MSIEDTPPEGAAPGRSAPRDSLFLLARISSADGADLGSARVRNLSATGMQIDSIGPLVAAQEVRIGLRDLKPIAAKVAWVEQGRAGIRFHASIDPAVVRRPVGRGGAPDVDLQLGIRRTVFRG